MAHQKINKMTACMENKRKSGQIMTIVRDIYNALCIIAPITDELGYDNEGLLSGSFDAQINKVLIALDATPEVCQEAHDVGAELLVTHHPVIYRPLTALNLDDAVHKLMKYDLNLLSMHTSLDVSLKGINYILTDLLGLQNVEGFSFKHDYTMGLMGELTEAMETVEFAEYVRTKLDCQGLRYTEGNKKIKKVAVCGGAGGYLVREAILAGADVLVTGEIKHSDILMANTYNLAVVDTGHYKSENVIVPFLQSYLQEWFPDNEFVVTKTFSDRIKYLCE